MPATLIFDGQCRFCTRSARRLQAFAGAKRLQIVAMDAPGAMDLHQDLSYTKALKAVQLILKNGYLCEGAEAAFTALSLRPGFGFLRVLYQLPLIKQLSKAAYWVFARGRKRCVACDH